MKKIIVFVVLIALYQNWAKIEAVLGPSLSKEQFAAAQNNSKSAGKVVLYGTSWCGYCKKTREFLVENNIVYTEFDSKSSDESRRCYDAINGIDEPVFEVNNSVIKGYAPEAILASLKHDSKDKIE